MDEWGWEQLRPWLEKRLELPVGAFVLRHLGSHARPVLLELRSACTASPRCLGSRG
jgi:hypothetical protein